MKGTCVYLLTLALSTVAVPKDACETCIPKDKCVLFKSLSEKTQTSLIEKLSCSPNVKDHYEKDYNENDDYVCCSNNLWGVEGKLAQLKKLEFELKNENTQRNIADPDNDEGINYDNDNVEYSENLNRKRRQNNRNIYWNERPGRNQWNNRNQDRGGRNNMQDYNRGRSYWQNNNNNRNWYPQSNGNNYPDKNYNSSSQCDRLTSLTPDPQSGCCGQEASDDDRITDTGTTYSAPDLAQSKISPRPNLNLVSPHTNSRGKREDVEVTIDNRIAGGSATELYQYPWTVLLLTTFNFRNKRASFNCGGSLINSQFVLSAAHCVYDRNGLWKSTQVTLAEYDKRSFPRDCKGSRCVENKIMFARNVAIHPQFNDDRLLNDISLIRLNGTAPFNDYIRPICLPPFNIDTPRFNNLQFEVAGWGQNGQIPSDVKRSTIMHLVSRNECRRSYPSLTDKHLCAAGNKGEDTCKGDSGGPLMMLFRGRYYVMGVVSGKRADTPCGNVIVPSLYTNVFYYLDWIQNNMRN